MSHVLGYPPKGTHAHSMVQVFMSLGMSELDAFRAYADVYPDDCLLLVDTIDTLESGVPNAIRVFEELRRKGHEPVGIRLDSGDLAYLSIQAAKMLDDAGFPETSIVLSNNLDELVILQIITQIEQEAPRYGVDADHLIDRLVYGVGTRLITSWGEPALGGVYKLVAVRDGGEWLPAIKVSEIAGQDAQPRPQAGLAAVRPARQGHRRPAQPGRRGPAPDGRDHPAPSHRTRDPAARLRRDELSEIEPLLVDVLLEGRLVYDLPVHRRDAPAPPGRCGAPRSRRAAADQPAHLPRLADAAAVGPQAGADRVGAGQERARWSALTGSAWSPAGGPSTWATRPSCARCATAPSRP